MAGKKATYSFNKFACSIKFRACSVALSTRGRNSFIFISLSTNALRLITAWSNFDNSLSTSYNQEKFQYENKPLYVQISDIRLNHLIYTLQNQLIPKQ